MEQDKPSRISSTTASLMIAMALLFDIISAIPLLGQALADVGSFLVFLIWFMMLGLPLISPKKLMTYAVTFVISVIPILSILPEITLAIVAFILITRAEDKLGVQVLSSKGLKNPAAIVGELKPQFNRLAQESGTFRGALAASAVVRGRPMNDMLPRNNTSGIPRASGNRSKVPPVPDRSYAPPLKDYDEIEPR